MIPKASQRGSGKDLATDLLNASVNEHVAVAEVPGAIAPDLHGAFAEWEAIANGRRLRRTLGEALISVDCNGSVAIGRAPARRPRSQASVSPDSPEMA